MARKQRQSLLQIEHMHTIDGFNLVITYHRFSGRVRVIIDNNVVLSRLTWLWPTTSQTFIQHSHCYRLHIRCFFMWSARLYRDGQCCIDELLPARKKKQQVKWLTSGALSLIRLLSKVL